MLMKEHGKKLHREIAASGESVLYPKFSIILEYSVRIGGNPNPC